MRQSIFRFVRDVFICPEHIRQVNHTLLTLVPKCNDPPRIVQSRLVALCNVMYKVVTKVLSNRLKIILPKVISYSHSSFVQSRHTTDNAIILQEIVHSFQNMKSRKGLWS